MSRANWRNRHECDVREGSRVDAHVASAASRTPADSKAGRPGASPSGDAVPALAASGAAHSPLSTTASAATATQRQRKRRRGTPCRRPTRSMHDDLTRRSTRKALGPDLAGLVTDAETGQVLWSQTPLEHQLPASNAKLVTAVNALSTFGPAYTITTKVVQGKKARRLFLVGGGDPSLHPRQPEHAREDGGPGRPGARAEHGAGAGRRLVVPGADSSPAAGSPAMSMRTYARYGRSSSTSTTCPTQPSTPARSLRSDSRSRASRSASSSATKARANATGAGHRARPVDGQHGRHHAARQRQRLRRGAAPAGGDQDRVRPHLEGRTQGAAEGPRPGSASTWARRRSTTAAGSPATTASPRSTSSACCRWPSTARTPTWRACSTTRWPSPDVTGTLAPHYLRYVTEPTKCAAGLIEAKTGSLSGVIALSGFARGADGRIKLFSFLLNHVPSTLKTRRAVDRLASTITGCW